MTTAFISISLRFGVSEVVRPEQAWPRPVSGGLRAQVSDRRHWCLRGAVGFCRERVCMLAVWPGTRELRWLVANGASPEQALAQRGAVTRASPPGQFLGWVGELQQREVTAVSWPLGWTGASGPVLRSPVCSAVGCQASVRTDHSSVPNAGPRAESSTRMSAVTLLCPESWKWVLGAGRGLRTDSSSPSLSCCSLA